MQHNLLSWGKKDLQSIKSIYEIKIWELKSFTTKWSELTVRRGTVIPAVRLLITVVTLIKYTHFSLLQSDWKYCRVDKEVCASRQATPPEGRCHAVLSPTHWRSVILSDSHTAQQWHFRRTAADTTTLKLRVVLVILEPSLYFSPCVSLLWRDGAAHVIEKVKMRYSHSVASQQQSYICQQFFFVQGFFRANSKALYWFHTGLLGNCRAVFKYFRAGPSEVLSHLKQVQATNWSTSVKYESQVKLQVLAVRSEALHAEMKGPRIPCMWYHVPTRLLQIFRAMI